MGHVKPLAVLPARCILLVPPVFSLPILLPSRGAVLSFSRGLSPGRFRQARLAFRYPFFLPGVMRPSAGPFSFRSAGPPSFSSHKHGRAAFPRGRGGHTSSRIPCRSFRQPRAKRALLVRICENTGLSLWRGTRARYTPAPSAAYPFAQNLLLTI